MNALEIGALAFAVATLAGCSSAPKPAAQPQQPQVIAYPVPVYQPQVIVVPQATPNYNSGQVPMMNCQTLPIFDARGNITSYHRSCN